MADASEATTPLVQGRGVAGERRTPKDPQASESGSAVNAEAPQDNSCKVEPWTLQVGTGEVDEIYISMSNVTSEGLESLRCVYGLCSTEISQGDAGERQVCWFVLRH